MPPPQPPRRLPPGPIHGFNLGPDAIALQDGTGDPWLATYRDWARTWPFLKLQVDLAAGAGANAIRLIGDIAGPIVGAFTRADYLARVGQVAGYCRSKGMYFYATAGGLPYLPGSDSAVIAEVVALAGMLAGHGNILGLDIYQECNSLGQDQSVLPGYTRPPTNAAALGGLITSTIAAIRAVAPALACTCSVTGLGGPTGAFGDPTAMTYVWPHVDYVDCHVYESNPAASWVAPVVAAFPGKQVLIGEHGANLHGSTAAARTSAVAAQRSVATAPGVSGSLLWAAINDLPIGTTYYGAWSSDGTTPLADVLTPYRTFPAGSRPVPPSSRNRRR